MGGDTIGTHRLFQCVTEGRSYAFPLVILMHIELIRGSMKQKNTIYKIALTGLLFGIFLTYMTESYFRFYRFLIVFALMYNLDTVLGNKKEEN